MTDCHEDKKINSLIGKKVKITFSDRKTEEGILTLPVFGNGYMLKTPAYDYQFYKSHVKRIEVMKDV